MVLDRKSTRLLVPMAVIAAYLLTGCSSNSYLHKYEFQDGYYQYRQGKEPFKKVYITVGDDSAKVYQNNEPISLTTGLSQVAVKSTFDFDVLTVPFKFRPQTMGMPRQLHADANGEVLLGWRVDRFKIRYIKTPSGTKRIPTHRGLSVGAFGGLGATAVTPWTTAYRTTDEYAGMVVTRGVAALVGLNNLTFGLGIGWDHLTDRDKNIWIYQNKAWYGITIGLNLN